MRFRMRLNRSSNSAIIAGVLLAFWIRGSIYNIVLLNCVMVVEKGKYN